MIKLPTLVKGIMQEVESLLIDRSGKLIRDIGFGTGLGSAIGMAALLISVHVKAIKNNAFLWPVNHPILFSW
jgi:hypothetical protein